MKRGFTLIELMVVITIIAILASVAIPSYERFIVRAQVSEAMQLVADLKADVQSYYKHKGQFPKDNQTAGLPESHLLIGNYVKSIDLVDGAFHVHLGNKAHTSLSGKILTIQPIVVTGSPASPISWVSGYGQPPEGMEAVGENRTDVDRGDLPFPSR